jgi:hypothetical protein
VGHAQTESFDTAGRITNPQSAATLPSYRRQKSTVRLELTDIAVLADKMM